MGLKVRKTDPTRLIKIVSICLTVVIAPGVLGLGGWNLTQAAKNRQDITSLKAERLMMKSALIRIEAGVVRVSQKQDELNRRLSVLTTAQAVVNEKVISHAAVDDKRTEGLQKIFNQHLQRGN